MLRIVCLFSLLIFSITGCGIYGMTQSDSKPTQAQISSADFGDPPEHYQDQIRSYFNANLVDPASMILEFGSPYKSWAQLPKEPNAKFPATYGFKNVFGWSVCGYVNSKNRMGGYAGRDMFQAFFRDGAMLSAIWGSPAWNACRGNEPKL